MENISFGAKVVENKDGTIHLETEIFESKAEPVILAMEICRALGNVGFVPNPDIPDIPIPDPFGLLKEKKPIPWRIDSKDGGTNCHGDLVCETDSNGVEICRCVWVCD